MLYNKEAKGLFFVLLTALISGFSIFVNKIGLQGINPFVFTGLKNTLVAFFLFSLILISGRAMSFKKISLKNWLTLLLIGIFGGGLPFLLFFKGLSLTTAAQASFVHKNLFLLATPLAAWFLKEKVNRNFLAVALLLVMGNLLFFRLTKFQFTRGDLLVLAATFLWAGESVVVKRVLKILPSQAVAFGRMLFGSLTIGAYLLITDQAALIDRFSIQQVGWIALTSLLLLGYMLTWYAGLKLVRVSVATSVLTLGSPVTALLSMGFLGSSYSSFQALGGLMLLVGVIVLHLRGIRCFTSFRSATSQVPRLRGVNNERA